MDRRERYPNPEETMRIALDSRQSEIYTCFPGIVQSFNPTEQTCSVQVALLFDYTDANGVKRSIKVPVLQDCPMVFPSGGGCTLTFPIAAGDEVLVQIASRCIDAWWKFGGVQPQPVFRMHDFSDGFVIPGVKSVPHAFAVDMGTVQLRSNDGAAVVSINPSTHEIKAVTSGKITAQASGEIDMTAPTIKLTGNIVLNGPISQTDSGIGGTAATLIGPLNVTNDVTAQGISLHNHVHNDPQGGTTSPPV